MGECLLPVKDPSELLLAVRGKLRFYLGLSSGKHSLECSAHEHGGAVCPEAPLYQHIATEQFSLAAEILGDG